MDLGLGLDTATEDHTVHFHQLLRSASDRIRNRRVNKRTGDKTDADDIVKGFEVCEGEYVLAEPDELDEVAPGRSQSIEISDFVDLDAITASSWACQSRREDRLLGVGPVRVCCSAVSERSFALFK
ncbi:Ku protein [Streptomyces collinus]|uniref:Ku protein n=1 Tax=Streptomyces collinus TaxID=42684 RepID=UPI002942B8DB|nr:Ku protein [Streptomyces collinus]